MTVYTNDAEPTTLSSHFSLAATVSYLLTPLCRGRNDLNNLFGVIVLNGRARIRTPVVLFCYFFTYYI